MKLPIGISTFKEIREDYVYVDKTKYIFEFKVRDEDPLKQIKEKRYYEKYSGKRKEVVIIGIVFDEKKRNIKKFVWEKV
ncbi:PD-(D/E)XK nuclease domain-containing protein [Desulfothermus sp.]